MIVICEECGKSFLIHNGNGPARLVCRGMTLHSHLYNCRKPKSVKYEPIADRLWEGVKAVLESEGSLEAAIQSRVEHVKQKGEAIKERLNKLSHELTKLKDEREIVITGFRKGFYSDEELQRQLEVIQEDEQGYKREIDSLSADLRLQDDAQSIHEQAKQLIPLMRARLDSNLADEDKQKIIKLLVRRALLSKFGDLTIELRVPAPDSFVSATSPRAG